MILENNLLLSFAASVSCQFYMNDGNCTSQIKSVFISRVCTSTDKDKIERIEEALSSVETEIICQGYTINSICLINCEEV